MSSVLYSTDIPARLDRLPWGRFRSLVIAALGVTWILDGLEVTLAGSVSGALKSSPVLHRSDAEIGLTASLHRRRSLSTVLVLMALQPFFYNAFFTYALVLGRFFAVPEDRIGLCILPFAAGNFLGPLLLGRLFDTIGRRFMIALTYAASGLLLLATGWLFVDARLGATGMTLAWSLVFCFAWRRPARPISRPARAFHSRCARSPSPSSMPSAPASAASSGPGCSACS